MSLVQRDREGQLARRRDQRAVAILAESSALLIAVAMALVPGRSGSTWSPADFFWDDPGLLLRIASTFVLMNVLLAVLGLVGWGVLRKGTHD